MTADVWDHCVRGHEYTPENTRARQHKNKNGTTRWSKVCRTCARDDARESWQRRHGWVGVFALFNLYCAQRGAPHA